MFLSRMSGAIFCACLLVPCVDAQEQRPHTDQHKTIVEIAVADAKDHGRSSVTIPPPLSDPLGLATSLPEALDTFSVVIVEPVTSHTMLQGQTIATWFRYHIVSTLHEAPSQPAISVPTPSGEMQELNDSNLLIGSAGGHVRVDGVDVTMPLAWPFDKSKQYVLFVSTRKDHVGVVAGGLQGVFEVGRDGVLIPKAAEEGPLTRSLLLNSANSIGGLRNFIQRRYH